MDETPLSVPAGLGLFEAAGADADDARSQMPIEDDGRIRAGRKGSPCRGRARASSAVPRDGEPGAVRLAAVEPEEAVRCCRWRGSAPL